MKSVLASLLLMSSLSANATCLGEAKMVAKVVQAKDCIASVAPQSVLQYTENPACPLTLNEVLNKGIQDCTLRADDTVKGLFVLTTDGKIIRD